MADPISWAIGSMVAGTTVSAVGAVRQGQAARAAGNYNAQVAEQDAEVARQQASVEAGQIDRENRLRLGRMRASAASAGIELGGGNVADLIGDVVAQGELQRQDALWRGEMRARGFKTEAVLSRFEGRDAARAGRLAATGELLGGFGSAGMAFAKFNPPGDG